MTTQRDGLFPVSRRRRMLTSAGLLGVIVAAGGLLTWWAVARADREMREDLLQQAQQVAQAMNTDRIQMLSGTPADIDNPAYTRVKSQLISVRSVYPQCRFLYLMGRRADGHLFLFMDSEPADLNQPAEAVAVVTGNGAVGVVDVRSASGVVVLVFLKTLYTL